MSQLLATLLVTFSVFMLAVGGMAVGWLVQGKVIKGSCGGLGGDSCGICKKPCDERVKKLSELEKASAP
ncbi:MAG: (Na+)-NQR maturation NqrM [Polycyclovorans sp.]|nr:(Na+)-NQR maturation NqrM [Polycyclovorans sp.]MEC8849569.1 (Na+)-NQR maturation NqrM [Pseudomonadota bacterium]